MDKKSLYAIIAVVVIIIAGAWLWLNSERTSDVSAPGTQGGTSAGNDTASINQDLDNINVEEPDFKGIDSDLNSL
ncbi:MAG: hypothetical protein HY432_01000 [Candidatus Liptonbacteria bacterium]|nr:hypothetical protein [Candidatus Liptonbacteria bacterium]